MAEGRGIGDQRLVTAYIFWTLYLSSLLDMSNARQQCAKSRLKDYMMTKQHMLLTYVFWDESDWLERLVSEMTYNVLMGTLNPTHSFIHSLTHSLTHLVELQSNGSRIEVETLL